MERHFLVASRQSNIPCLIMANNYLHDNPRQTGKFLKNNSRSWAFLQELSCMLQVDVSHLNRYSLFTTVKKLWKLLMEYTLYLQPQFAKFKKSKQNSVKTGKNDFVETYLLNLPNSCVLLLRVLQIFFFPFIFSSALLSCKQKYRTDRLLSGARGPRHLERTQHYSSRDVVLARQQSF